MESFNEIQAFLLSEKSTGERYAEEERVPRKNGRLAVQQAEATYNIKAWKVSLQRGWTTIPAVGVVLGLRR